MNLKQTIAITFAYYYPGRSLPDEVVAMYVSDLSDLDVTSCIETYNRWRRNPSNKKFPLPAEIRELVNPGEFVAIESQAREIAARICGAVPRFGWNNAKQAELFIGPEGWSAVQRQGGWQYLCEQMGSNINPATFQAQIRDQIEGSLRYGGAVIERSIGVLPQRGTGLTSIKEIMSSGLDQEIRLMPDTKDIS